MIIDVMDVSVIVDGYMFKLVVEQLLGMVVLINSNIYQIIQNLRQLQLSLDMDQNHYFMYYPNNFLSIHDNTTTFMPIQPNNALLPSISSNSSTKHQQNNELLQFNSSLNHLISAEKVQNEPILSGVDANGLQFPPRVHLPQQSSFNLLQMPFSLTSNNSLLQPDSSLSCYSYSIIQQIHQKNELLQKEVKNMQKTVAQMLAELQRSDNIKKSIQIKQNQQLKYTKKEFKKNIQCKELGCLKRYSSRIALNSHMRKYHTNKQNDYQQRQTMKLRKFGHKRQRQAGQKWQKGQKGQRLKQMKFDLKQDEVNRP